MNTLEHHFRKMIITVLLFALCLSAAAQPDRKYFGVEIDGVLCGYATSDCLMSEYNGKAVLETYDSVHLLLKVLGQDLTVEMIKRHILDPETYQVILNEMEYNTSDVGRVITTRTEIFDGYAVHRQEESNLTDTLQIPEDLIFDNPITLPYLLEDFRAGQAGKKTYRIYDFVKGVIAEQEFSLVSEEVIHLAGKDFTAMVFSINNKRDGTNTRVWIDKQDGASIQFEIMNRRIFLTESAVLKNIQTVDMDNTIFARVDQSIPNFMEMSYLKVKADIKSAGEAMSVESLNFPGQKFSGTVIDNHIQGIFEITPIWYDGSGAPSFPTDYSGDESLKKYLEPELFIESDHHEVIAKAGEITKGAQDSWEAAVLLSEWVGKEIRGAVPGGTSAINTLRIREGECGSHSRLLAAFCRSVGIPSRLALGCLYSPWYGGSFGQHAWTEVYMGEDIGWIAVDATILEFDYVDAGHIKLGEGSSFQPESMEILEYRIGDGDASVGIPEEYLPLIGQYTHPVNRDVIDVIYADGSLSVDIMNRMVLALNAPDEKGRMYAKLTDQVYFTFPDNDMVVVEKTFATKRADVEISIDEETPDEYQAMIGSYLIARIQKEFKVIWNGKLSMMVPDVEEPRTLEYQEENDRWKDIVDKKEYAFMRNTDGSISGMTIYISTELKRGTTAAWIIDKAIEEEGMEAAEAKFTELWNNRALDLDYTEADMNKQGYIYLNANKIEEALLVFRLNVDAFPQSWNAYDSYGEAQMKKGETEKAIESYLKSLEINPENENGIQMLEKLNSIKEE